MADYKDIVGTAVRNNAGNLSADQKDQIFYDSTNVDFKYQFEAKADAWRTTAPLNQGRSSGIMGGTKDSSWVAGGEQPTSQATNMLRGVDVGWVVEALPRNRAAWIVCRLH